MGISFTWTKHELSLYVQPLLVLLLICKLFSLCLTILPLSVYFIWSSLGCMPVCPLFLFCTHVGTINSKFWLWFLICLQDDTQDNPARGQHIAKYHPTSSENQPTPVVKPQNTIASYVHMPNPKQANLTEKYDPEEPTEDEVGESGELKNYIHVCHTRVLKHWALKILEGTY